MLDKDGFTECTLTKACLNICAACFRSLSKLKVSRLALANKLYCGQLPLLFRDLTWVKEMVCAIYSNTTHVTRLYQLSDATQPFVFHGNTCAHETNVVSTIKVLPQTPADINDMLSVIFIGTGKLDASSLHTIFCIRM
ncbi:uncharacterized protein EDB93DRAFT_1098257 [Suillus bovinus]|uniref:uncharacterized protein n=1 Tax=Suillus bovinus TaxID=48563 RepID=UPI001B883A3D|nr:uncharacterized protein EDB93DRAFT_1098257 [Suillus bovinus]KAG2124853.1 hypothetical protein EDB93DRAFT_1098257 [Suillus bovinus]